MLHIRGQTLFTLEDRVPADGVKVAGKTAIPAGTYRVILTWSPRFKRVLPLLVGDEAFEKAWSGVRIHAGNSHHDTEGCILVGETQHGPDQIGDSANAMRHLMHWMMTAEKRGIPITLEIKDAN